MRWRFTIIVDPAHHADQHQRARERERFHVGFEVFRTDVIENNVDSAFFRDAPDFPGKVLFAVIDDMMGALFPHAVQLAARRRDEDFRLGRQGPAQLYRRGGDAAPAAVDQNRIPAFQLAQ
jgi:hypothetical protein